MGTLTLDGLCHPQHCCNGDSLLIFYCAAIQSARVHCIGVDLFRFQSSGNCAGAAAGRVSSGVFVEPGEWGFLSEPYEYGHPQRLRPGGWNLRERLHLRSFRGTHQLLRMLCDPGWAEIGLDQERFANQCAHARDTGIGCSQTPLVGAGDGIHVRSGIAHGRHSGERLARMGHIPSPKHHDRQF
jgi:hypothetical protein